ncbi:MAG: TonB-dependent receptor plug domain-containing protein [Bacteroidota bacterium]
MKLIFAILFSLPLYLFSQTSELTVKVIDYGTKEPVSGAKVVLNEKFKALTDFDGNAVFQSLPLGKYNLVVSMLSFDTIAKGIELKNAIEKIEITLGGSLELEEIKVIGNIVSDRKTPVAVTKIDPKKIQEELGSRDLPMLLNSTPGVYATQTGGGDGDSRITVRGFDQRNIGVMIDGVPVNDMENGSVYWSNWFGLDAITSNVQLQRGLGATKLAMPSIGGTMNIITQGIGGRKGFNFKQELASGTFLRSTLSYNSGLMKNGFGVTFSGSYKQGNGWVDGTPTQGAFFYLKVQKKIKNHLLSLSAFTAPQKHGQRSFNQQIQYFDNETAQEQGLTIDTNLINDRGVKFNEHYGYETVDGKRKVLNERTNYYQKPQITLKDFWQVNKKLSISNILYASIGKGGGTRLLNNAVRAEDGTIDWDAIKVNNQTSTVFGQVVTTVDPLYHPTEYKSNNIITASVNNHFWVGGLSQFTYAYSEKLNFSGGLDYRNYKGTHYREIKNLLGGDYFVNSGNKNQASPVLRVGDKLADVAKPYENHRDGFVQWAGAFGQMEYSGTRWTTFVNLSGVYNSYRGVDYFQKKVLELNDTTLRIGYEDTITYKGTTYDRNSSGLEFSETDKRWVPGFTFKTGASYTINEESTVFVNAGYLSRTPMFSNVIDNNTNTFFRELVNEKILAFEGGYSYANKKFGINFNGYATNWKNKPIPFGLAIPDPLDPTTTIRINVNGMDAIHVGGEIDMAWEITKKLSTEIMLSYGDWRWTSKESLYVPELNDTISFDAKGVHVGDAAQSVYSLALRYEPFKNFYVKVQYMYFDRYYGQFDPFSLSGVNAGHDAWKLPAYGIMNLFTGYRYKMKKSDLLFNGGITNVLNTVHMTDANDNYYAPKTFDAQSAAVMFGQGLRFNISIALQF